MAFINACISDSSAPYKEIKRVQFGILSPDEIVILCLCIKYKKFIKIF